MYSSGKPGQREGEEKRGRKRGEWRRERKRGEWRRERKRGEWRRERRRKVVKLSIYRLDAAMSGKYCLSSP